MLNNLPLNWCECKFGDVGYLQNGYAFNSKLYKEKGVNLIRISDIQDNEVILDNCVKVSEKVDECFQVHKGDFLLAMSGATTGKTGIYNSEDEALLNQRVGNLKIYDEKVLLPKFRNYFISNKRSLIEKLAYGGAQPNISKAMIEDLDILLPPLAEQERIVEKIEVLFNDIDEGVERLKSAQAQIKQYRQSVLKSAFEGKLYKTTDWKEVSLEFIVSPDKYGMKRGPFGSSLKKEFFVSEGIRVFEQYNPINNDPYWCRYFISREKYKELNAFKAGPGDLLISCSGTLGKIIELPSDTSEGIINQALLKIRLNNEKILNRFFINWFNSNQTQKLILDNVRGAAIQNIASVKELKKIPLYLPTLPEQQRIVTEIEKRFAVADELEKAVNEGLEKADKLKQSIFKKAFEGKLVAQNPNDEPASILLERIKKEKQVQTKGKKK